MKRKKQNLFDQDILEAMPSEKLVTILEYELQQTDIRDEQVRQIMAVLEQRDRPASEDCAPKAAQTWKVQNLRSPKDSGKCGPGHWLRVASIAITVFFVLGFAVPEVLGAENIFELIGRWTKDIFVFIQPEDTTVLEAFTFHTEDPGLRQLYDTVKALGGPEEVVPTWMPEGYELVEIDSLSLAEGSKVAATWDNGVDQIVCSICVYKDRNIIKLHKDCAQVEEYEMFGVLYYITGNLRNQTATWAAENAVCTITASERSVLLDMIQSIYEER